MEEKRILIIDDDPDLSGIIADMLEDHGYCTQWAGSSQQAFDMLEQQRFHVILLDINLPDGTGFELCSSLRQVSDTPVIFASARTSESDRIQSFDIGGDDFLPKPYSMQELLSRVNALVRRVYGNQREQVFRFGDTAVDLIGRRVTRNGAPVGLSLREFDLLAYLCSHCDQAVPKDKLLAEVWGAFSSVEPSTLTVHIRWLREKLEPDPGRPIYIRTVFKVGYMLTPEGSL